MGRGRGKLKTNREGKAYLAWAEKRENVGESRARLYATPAPL